MATRTAALSERAPLPAESPLLCCRVPYLQLQVQKDRCLGEATASGYLDPVCALFDRFWWHVIPQPAVSDRTVTQRFFVDLYGEITTAYEIFNLQAKIYVGKNPFQLAPQDVFPDWKWDLGGLTGFER